MANETNYLMDDSRYQASGAFYSLDESKVYAPKKWEDNEIIERIEMNNLEQGIQIALESRSTMENIKDEFITTIRTDLQNFNNEVEEINGRIDGFENQINNSVDNRLSAQNNDLKTTLQQIIGTTDYDIQSIPYTRPNNINPIDVRITQLYNEVFGEGSSGSTSSNSLNARLQALTNNVSDLPTNISAIIGPRLGSAYYSNNTWLDNYTDIDTRITEIYNAIFGNSSSGSNRTIIEQINDLNTAIFGSSDGGDSSGSRIDKIIAVLGRELPEAEDIPESGFLTDSLISKINTLDNLVSNILETLGMSGESTNDYTFSDVLIDLYGELTQKEDGTYSRDEHPLIDTLKTIPGTIATLNTKVTATETANTQLSTRITTVEGWKNTIDDVYTDADIVDLEDDETTYLRLKREETEKPTNVEGMNADIKNTYIPLPKGGGSGGTTISGTASITRVTEASVQILTGKPCFIEYKLEARDSSGELVGDGTATWFVGGVQVATSSAKNLKSDTDTTTINNDFNISPYLSVGTNNIILQVSVNTGGEYNTIVRKTWTINVVNFSFTWDYNEETIFNTGVITLEWIPYGANLNKTTHIYIDKGTDHEIYLTRTTLQSGITQTYTFEHNLSHGTHTCEIFLTATIDNKNETTDSQFHDIIVLEPSNITPIISSSPLIEIMKKDEEGNFIKDEDGIFIQEMEQYDTVALPIVIYTPNSTLTSNIVLAVNGETVDIWNNINRSIQYWNYSPTTIGEKILTISVGSVIKKIHISVKSVEIDNEEIGDYDFKIKASDIVSNSDLRNNELLTFSDNFDWINGGLKTERDANRNIQQYICIKAGTTLTINKQLFNSNLTNGLNFKIILKTANCSDYDAKILDCYSNEIGIQLFAHRGFLKSSGQSVSTQYGENVYIELEFEVYGTNNNPRYIMCWVDGVMSTVRVCNSTDLFEQTDKSNIIIGSTNCDVYIYLVKSYYKKLSIDEHIANFISDAPNATTMKARYNRNNILGDDGEIDYNLLYKAAPDCRIWLYDISRMTTAKDDPVLVNKFTQMWLNGGKEYYDGLTAKNAALTVQGTSSVNYRKGAANTDINFTKYSNAELASASGENLLAEGLEHKGIKLTDTSIPITYANMKVNFASCEQVNNMCNAMWYQNFQPYPSLSERDCMEFVMGVQFILDRGIDEPTIEDPVTHESVLEVPLFSEKPLRQSEKYYMYSIGNLGNSKKNTHIFHNDNECCIEVNDNTTEGQRMITWPEDLDWTGKVKNMDHSYGMRFPNTKTPDKMITDGWERFVKWMASRNPKAATNEPLESPETYETYTFRGHEREGTQVLRGSTVSEYAGTYTIDSFERRMAKMLSECEDYMAMDSVVYHFCYIERHTMVDNVAKNTFWSAAKTIKNIDGEDQEGYWIWDLSKNYDNDTSDGNNNEGQLVFDYGNEADDSINGKMVFNAADSVWFIFISNLTEACATMFINRESARSKDGKFSNAWNSLTYHNFLLNEQQKIPERVWNECYRYDYLRPYERGINTGWLSFLDGGQKIHQRQHYETFQELYLASKYMSPRSVGNIVTLRGYTPTITNDMDEETKEIIRTSLSVVPSKSEVSVKMYNKCYVTVHMGNNHLHEKAQKGELKTLVFREKNGNYLGLNDTVINIDTASMIQEIGDLSPLYPGQSSFGAAYRLRSIKIGSNIEGYQNLNISDTEQGTFDFSTNSMLERLEIQNLKAVSAPLSLEGCPALKYLDASGSSFSGYSFADGGLLETAYLGYPNAIVMKNLNYLKDSNFIINDLSNLKYLTIDNCAQIDTFNRTLSLDNLLLLNLLNVNWKVQGIDFKQLFEKVKTIPNYAITGTIKLTENMGDFDIEELQNYFTNDLKFFYTDEENIDHEYYNIRFFDPNGKLLKTLYTIGGQGSQVIYDIKTVFNEEELLAYNLAKDPNWVWGAPTRWNLKEWDKPLINIQDNLDVFPVEDIEYKIDYILQTADINKYNTITRYYFEGEFMENLNTDDYVFERNYYQYRPNYWTTDGNQIADSIQTGDNREEITDQIKTNTTQTWYAVYSRSPQTYKVKLYNTDINGLKQGEPLLELERTVVAGGIPNKILYTDIENYLPVKNNQITMIGDESEREVDDEERIYRYLSVKPFVPTGTSGLRVTGNMDLLITYYHKDDIFTNYFLNKIVSCDLGSITTIPKAAFFHSTNLKRLKTEATFVDSYAFSYANTLNRKIYIFTGTNIDFEQYCFNSLNNGIIVFTGSGQIRIDNFSFNNMQNCNLIILNSELPIISKRDRNSGFSGFIAGNNYLYVKNSVVRDLYPNSINSSGYANVPYSLIESERSNIRIVDATNTTYQALMEEVGPL